MKKVIFGFILGMIVCISLQSIATTTIFNATPASFDVYVNGEKFISENPPVVINGRTYLPTKETGVALNIPVDWNIDKKRVEVNMRKINSKAQKELNVNSKTFEINDDRTVAQAIMIDNKYFVKPKVLYKYIESKDLNLYFNIPGREPILFQTNNIVNNYAIKYQGMTYIDIEACYLKYSVDNDTLWIEF